MFTENESVNCYNYIADNVLNVYICMLYIICTHGHVKVIFLRIITIANKNSSASQIYNCLL